VLLAVGKSVFGRLQIRRPLHELLPLGGDGALCRVEILPMAVQFGGRVGELRLLLDLAALLRLELALPVKELRLKTLELRQGRLTLFDVEAALQQVCLLDILLAFLLTEAPGLFEKLGTILVKLEELLLQLRVVALGLALLPGDFLIASGDFQGALLQHLLLACQLRDIRPQLGATRLQAALLRSKGCLAPLEIDEPLRRMRLFEDMRPLNSRVRRRHGRLGGAWAAAFAPGPAMLFFHRLLVRVQSQDRVLQVLHLLLQFLPVLFDL
jgi:hypothetical protein